MSLEPTPAALRMAEELLACLPAVTRRMAKPQDVANALDSMGLRDACGVLFMAAKHPRAADLAIAARDALDRLEGRYTDARGSAGGHREPGT